MPSRDAFDTLRSFNPGRGGGRYHSLAALEAAGLGRISRLPRTLAIVLESLVRNCDGRRVTAEHVRALAGWRPDAARTAEIPFLAVRIVLQDMIGFPTLNDLTAMRAAAARLGHDPRMIEPLVPVDAVVDHSVEVDFHGTPDALRRNMELEFRRNEERYRFVKWAQGAYANVRVIPPGNGIIHQVNIEHLSRCVRERDGLWHPDTVVGTDSHTPMVNGIGVVGWGVGGIEAEAAMLGQPVTFLTPDVVGVHLRGRLREGVTATDLALTVTERLRRAGVVGKFVEFFGGGVAALAAPDRAVVANMAPEYGATMGYFSVDERTLEYLSATGRDPALVDAVERYYRAQGLFGAPRAGDIDYSEVVELDLGQVTASVAGPRRPQDRVDLPRVKARFAELLARPLGEGGYGKSAPRAAARVPVEGAAGDVGHGDVLIAAITSCTNTSNPALLLAAGLMAKKAVEKGLAPHPRVKTSLAPGSKVVTAYLRAARLLPFLEAIGFGVVAYGCTTCMGAAGPLAPGIEEAVAREDIVACAVLSGNRNFEARVHANIKANFLASPPLVLAYALAGTVNVDLTTEPLGAGADGRPVFLRDIWPTDAEVAATMEYAANAADYLREYGELSGMRELWDAIPVAPGAVYPWDRESTWITEPPYLLGFGPRPAPPGDITGARALAIYGDSITTDHISPVSRIRPGTPAGSWLAARGVAPSDFSHFGTRRCNHEVMIRGAFTNARIRNLLAPGTEGDVTVHQPSGEKCRVFDAAMRYRGERVPLIVVAGEDYGMGSSRDWAAKAPLLLGVKAVLARSFERIHRANLVHMGVLPCQFQADDGARSLGLDGTETFDLAGLRGGVRPRQEVTMTVRRRDGTARAVTLTARVDIPIEAEYFAHGGILPYVLRQLLQGS
ncbi:MAG: aconitate hydratase AcnA [Burkholderiales bacterium]|nr:aconitate hydratase AcnA [Burkholderiales bacterium]